MRAAWLFAIAACGNDVAPVTVLVDATADAPPDTLTPPAGCDYAEQNDPLNDITLGNGSTEQTNLTLATGLVICGRVDNQHLIEDRVDVDAFEIVIADRTDLRIDFAGEAGAVDQLEVAVIDSVNSVVERGVFLGTHVAFTTTLAAGTYRLVVTATNPTDVPGFDYKLRVLANPATCARVTAAATHTETVAETTGNDVIEIVYATGARTLTAGNDSPEASGVTTTVDQRISGVSADVDGADDFRDRDTYLFETGTNDELAIRVDWTGDADLDVFVFPEASVVETGRGTSVSKTAPERAVFPVLPNTRYWLWVGSYDSSAGLPVDYDVTLCPVTFGL